MQVWSLFKFVILRKRENLISVSLETHLIYFSIWEAHTDNSKSNKFFMRNLLQPPPQMLGWSTLNRLEFHFRVQGPTKLVQIQKFHIVTHELCHNYCPGGGGGVLSYVGYIAI